MVYIIENYNKRENIRHILQLKCTPPKIRYYWKYFSPSNKSFVKSTVLKPYKTREIGCILIPKDDLF